jgi:hypothetical protein
LTIEDFLRAPEFKRSTLHDVFKGSRQGGISVCANYPYIFIFSGHSGEQHGYKDEWENENVFAYTGERQVGDMQFIKGNLALRNHLLSNKRVFLFQETRRSHVKFSAELELLDFDFFQGEGRDGNSRTAIKFFFKRKGASIPYWPPKDVIAAESEPKPESPTKLAPDVTERKGLVTSRVGQGAYRKSILHRWQYKCAVTQYEKPEILIASHIVPWRDATNDQRLDVDNGILLSPVYDALFDTHLISFEDSGKIILSDLISKSNFHLLGVSGKERIARLSGGNLPYLEKHRNFLFGN